MKLSFTEKTIIDIVSKNIIEGGDEPCYLDEKGKCEDFLVCGVSFYAEKIEVSGATCTIEKIAQECDLKIETGGEENKYYWVNIPIKMFPTLALLSKVAQKID